MRKELYEFREDKARWTYTSADDVVVYGGREFTPIPITRNEVTQKNELNKASLEISVPLDSEIANLWLARVVDIPVSLTVYETDGITTVVTWKGRLVQAKGSSSSATLRFESIATSMGRQGLRRPYSRTCPHMLYGRGCNLDAYAFHEMAIVTSIVGSQVIVSITPEDNKYTGGVLGLADQSSRFIEKQLGNQITLIRPFEKLAELFAEQDQMMIYLYPGCDRSFETCRDKFNNQNNFGGFPQLPSSSDDIEDW